ncbi:hypothetical protein MPTK1_6g06070 [Marchantia polymorpha subsp. ruderalis]|uniref:Uncharacterized protein n=2 Tax=Marchantia polymorpha TaxID=3197 RepID=A0AAF6BP26_MARPO|nr:hypothetical protein MARPO_0097s0038 [Marchantia polymorpha]BBN13760.1 hypothetical protein Mp_6g06070 [Marchantia polymorpha subsp. ruderalis]|eukprot:PTQ32553.1 hypothetical protein MARPO_0097s0038 [Marchantia polymorpha]
MHITYTIMIQSYLDAEKWPSVCRESRRKAPRAAGQFDFTYGLLERKESHRIPRQLLLRWASKQMQGPLCAELAVQSGDRELDSNTTTQAGD